MILPQFVILPIAVLLIWLALARGIEPLHAVQQRIRAALQRRPEPDRRAARSRRRWRRWCGAINDLLARLDESIRAQKHFLADAAHQLKTPLAGLRTQAELARARDRGRPARSGGLRESLRQIARSSQSAAHMVNQLLAMARAEHEEHARRATSR